MKTKNLENVFEDLNSINLNKYKHEKFKEKINQMNGIMDLVFALTPDEKILLIYENMIENFFLFYSLNPNEETLKVAKKFLGQARDYYEYVIKPYFDEKPEIKNTEEEKIKKLEEFMKDIEINI